MQVPLPFPARTADPIRPSRIARATAITCLLALAVVGLATAVAGAGAPDATETAAPGVQTPSAQTLAGPSGPGASGPAGASEHVAECAADPPANHTDPEGTTSEVVGWVDGYWYDEPIDVAADDGLNETEAERLTARTAARVEAIRCLTFEEVPPVETLTRSEFREEIDRSFDRWETEDVRRFQNARLAAMLLVGTEEDAAEVVREHRTEFPAAFYDLEAEYIGLITGDPDEIEVDETTLAHELDHALQDQNFERVGEYDRATNDRNAAVLALIEGEARVVQARYERACEAGAWTGGCVSSTPSPPGGPVNWGLAVNDFYPYSDGYAFVQHRYDEGGWEAVNAVYDDPPNTTLETTYPERYGEVDLPEIDVEDRSDEDWERITVEEGPNYDVVGQHGLTSMLVVPTLDPDSETAIVTREEFLTGGQWDRLEYDQPETDGWRGDRLYGYTDGEDVAAVWTIAWADADEAEAFAAAYRDLIEYRGGSPAEGYDTVYVFEGEYEMALAIEQDGDRLRIVTAPTVEDLTAVHGDLDIGGDGDEDDGDEDGDDGSDGDDGAGTDQNDSTDDGDGNDGATDDGDDGTGAGDDANQVPGFGVLAALAALAVVGLRRR